MMNLENLFYVVYEHFQNTEEYHKMNGRNVQKERYGNFAKFLA